ncbi:dCTP pyrophosphatase [uncultured Caudovirales phage]|uniref:dCTP pyrophosphatase n=1 Tax=uncultured Caudovirales phage TaxID=2100421 RepID=A0A6J5KTX8_9CAUD|nr:dCTP pyrophosphatase [uncultured Caudovirales phage]
MNPENSCSHLFNDNIKKLDNPIVDMFNMQLSLQRHLAEKGRALNYDTASHKEKVNDISNQWRNISLEFAELLERLPFKEWKSYSPEQLAGFKDDADKLETYYEYIDMFHFFMNIGLALGIDGDTFEKLYVTKNQENFDRQARGY